MKIAFFDRDGTLIWEPPETKQIDSLEKLRILPGVIEGLKTLRDTGYQFVMVSNQNGIGTARFPRESFEVPQEAFLAKLKDEGIEFLKVFVCPHMPNEQCSCRKPKTGLVDAFLSGADIDKENSFMLGDRETDRQFGDAIGVRFIAMECNGRFPRFAFEKRSTRETNIEVCVNLDGSGRSTIQTGIGFFDHMLELFAKHALIDLTLIAKGDLQVDEHHTVEDCALTLGSALSKALGDKRGIERYGFWVPMDEALSHVVVDLSGRPFFVFRCCNTSSNSVAAIPESLLRWLKKRSTGVWNREYIGDLPTELIPHFFASFAQSLRCNLHMELKRGENEHHKAEALFKGLGRALRQALRNCPHECDIPSSKGIL